MADKAISDLTQALQITGEDLFVLQQNGEAKKLKGSQVVQYAKDSVAAEVQGVKEYADTAKASADAAAKDATRAETAAQGIDDKVAAADASAKAAASSAAAAAASATGVDEKVQAAQTAAANAAKSETAAKDAQTAAANAQKAAESAQTDAQTAKLDAQKAWEDAERAKLDASASADSARQESAKALEHELNAQSAKVDAEMAKTDAQAARDSIVNMIVEAVTLASGSDATVSKSVVDNVFKLAFGIPRGNPGADAPTITGITIRQSDYHMIVSLSDGATYDAGYCRGAAGAGSGDMLAAVYDPQGKQLDIYKYVDEEIAKIPTPDVSGKLDKPANNTTATAGQLLTKTADGQEWQDREKDVLNVTLTDTGPAGNPYVSNPAPDEILAAAQAGKVIELHFRGQIFFVNQIAVNAITGEATLSFLSSSESASWVTMTTFVLYRESRNAQWEWNYSSADTSMLLSSIGDSSNTTVGFIVASTRTALESGTELTILMGKIAKWFADLGSLAFKSTVEKSDLASDVQESLGKADSALQTAPVTSVNGQIGDVEISADSDVFWANINVTTYTKITEALNDGKIVLTKDDSGNVYMATYNSSALGVYFTSMSYMTPGFSYPDNLPAGVTIWVYQVYSQNDGATVWQQNNQSLATSNMTKPTTRKVTLTASGWNSSTKQQTVTCSGVLSDATKQLLIPTPVNTAAGNPYDEASIQMVAQGANSVTFYADTVPTVGIDVYVTIYPINYLG